jgi:hypothetical protein
MIAALKSVLNFFSFDVKNAADSGTSTNLSQVCDTSRVSRLVACRAIGRIVNDDEDEIGGGVISDGA